MGELRRLLLGLCVAVGAMLASATVAPAQLPTPAPGLYAPDYGTLITQMTTLRQSLGQPARGAVRRERARAERKKERRAKRKAERQRERKPPTAKQRAALRFVADPAVTAEVDRRFAEGFGAPGVDVETVIADLTRLRGLAATDLSAFGWRATDLADVAAYALLGGYLRVNDETRVPANGAAAVRRELRDVLAAKRSVRNLADARQQELAETLLLRIGYSAAHLNTLLDQGDEAGAAEVREQLRSFIQGVFGVDPTRVRIGSRGLVPRN